MIAVQSDRDRFIMSRQIKDAYLYRHRLQMREKQIQNSKQRLTGYIFHEVRVPLNTASKLPRQTVEINGLMFSQCLPFRTLKRQARLPNH